MKIVINKCFGGFGVSDEAMYAIAERKNLDVEKSSSYSFGPFYVKGTDKQFAIDDDDFYTDSEREFVYGRTDPDFVAVVEQLGSEKASGHLASLKVVEIPDDVDYYIHDYDGIESVNEKHRNWS